MARTYTLKRRAERREQTRRRIVEAAVALHTTIGPVRTSISAIAERAGVQRHTFYRHFPTERALLSACTELYQERSPLPDAEAWRTIAGIEPRLRHGLRELYAYYARNGDALAPVLRDAAVHPATSAMVELRLGPYFARMRAVLAEPFKARGRRRHRLLGMLELMLSLDVWRTLNRCTASRHEAVEPPCARSGISEDARRRRAWSGRATIRSRAARQREVGARNLTCLSLSLPMREADAHGANRGRAASVPVCEGRVGLARARLSAKRSG